MLQDSMCTVCSRPCSCLLVVSGQGLPTVCVCLAPCCKLHLQGRGRLLLGKLACVWLSVVLALRVRTCTVSGWLVLVNKLPMCLLKGMLTQQGVQRALGVGCWAISAMAANPQHAIRQLEATLLAGACVHIARGNVSPTRRTTESTAHSTEACHSAYTTHQQQQPFNSHKRGEEGPTHMRHLWPPHQHRPSTPHYKLRPPLSQNRTHTPMQATAVLQLAAAAVLQPALRCCYTHPYTAPPNRHISPRAPSEPTQQLCFRAIRVSGADPSPGRAFNPGVMLVAPLNPGCPWKQAQGLPDPPPGV